MAKDRTNLIIWVGLLAVAYFWFRNGSPSIPKSYQEYPPMAKSGYLTFDQWQKQYGGNSQLDYEDWLLGN